MTVEINGVRYKMRYSLRGLVMYEAIKDRPDNKGGLMDEIILFYSILAASNEDSTMTFEEFFEAMDSDMIMFSSIKKWFAGEVGELYEKLESPVNEKKKD